MSNLAKAKGVKKGPMPANLMMRKMPMKPKKGAKEAFMKTYA